MIAVKPFVSPSFASYRFDACSVSLTGRSVAEQEGALMATVATVDRSVLREAIQHEYAEVATCPASGFHFHVGRFLARAAGVSRGRGRGICPTQPSRASPVSATRSRWGSFNPERPSLDLGSGAGFDAILAAQQVGATGAVIGIDMTPAMLDKARANADALGLSHVEFREGYIENLPVEDASVDVVISNGVINLSPDKEIGLRRGRIGCSSPAAGYSSPTSSSAGRCRNLPGTTSASGPAELPARCRRQR